MIDLSCLRGPPPPLSETLFSDGVFSMMAALLAVALIVAAIAAPLVRSRYRKRVVRLMGFDQIEARPSVAPEEGSTPAKAARTNVTALRPLGIAELAKLAAQRERRVTRATLAAWFSFVLLALWVAGIDPQADLSGRLGFAAVAGLLALGPAMTNLPPRWTRWALSIGVTACIAGALLMLKLDRGLASDAPAADDDLPWWETALIGASIGGAYLAMVHRSLRGQVLPVFVVIAVCMLVFLLPYGLLERHAGSCLALFEKAEEGSPLSTAVLLIAMPIILGGLWLSFKVLGGMVRLIEGGWVSELSLTGAIGLSVIAAVAVMGQIPEANDSAPGWSVWIPLPWLAATLAVYALALGKAPGDGAGPQLLVLRVFSKDSRKHSLLDQMQARWRYVGAVHQIGGPDMVDLNVDPHESALFLSNRIHELFLPVAASPAQLRASLHTTPDREGRFRINEVFCFNTAWRATVEQLMQLSDVIVLDLRELTAQREGTSFEIRRLARAALLSRVVALGDNATDWSHVDELLRAEGQDPQQLARLNIATEPHGDSLFGRLLAAATRRSGAGRVQPEPRA